MTSSSATFGVLSVKEMLKMIQLEEDPIHRNRIILFKGIVDLTVKILHDHLMLAREYLGPALMANVNLGFTLKFISATYNHLSDQLILNQGRSRVAALLKDDDVEKSLEQRIIDLAEIDVGAQHPYSPHSILRLSADVFVYIMARAQIGQVLGERTLQLSEGVEAARPRLYFHLLGIGYGKYLMAYDLLGDTSLMGGNVESSNVPTPVVGEVMFDFSVEKKE